MPIYELDGARPELPADGDYWVADTAVLVGRVRLKPGASVWFGAVLRGDNEWIEIGEGSNVQDGAVLHTDIGYPLTVGARCTVGHQAILHGCRIGQTSLIGMGAVILNGAEIGSHCVVGAHALVAERKSFGDGQLIVGAPGKALRALGEGWPERLAASAEGYRRNAARFRAGLKRIG